MRVSKFADLLVGRDFQLGSKGDLGPVQQTSKHLASLSTVSVNGLLSDEHKVRLLFL